MKKKEEPIKLENSNKEDFSCSCCDKKVDTVYFYCVDCHNKKKKGATK